MSDHTILKPTVWQPPRKKANAGSQQQEDPKAVVYSPDCLDSRIYTGPGLYNDPERPQFEDLPSAMRQTLLLQYGKPTPLGQGPRQLSREQLAELKVTTPPGTPSLRGATMYQREEDLPQSVFQFPDSIGPIQVGGTQYPANEIRMMNWQLNEARRAGYFPRTASPPMDFQAIVDDYQMLCQLREARGDLAHPAPEAWRLLRVEISRRIQDRDAALENQQREAEAARRVESYMHSVNLEHRMFQQANEQPTQQNQTGSGGGMGEELYSIVKNAVEHNMAEAAAPLRMNANRHASLNREMSKAFGQQQIHAEHQLINLEKLKKENKYQLKTMEQQNNQLLTNIERLHNEANSHTLALDYQTTTIASQVDALSSLLAPQQERLVTTSQNLDLASDIVSNLSQIVDSLPTTITQAVQQAVQEQTQVAIRDVMETQARLQEQTQQREEAQRRQKQTERVQGWNVQRPQPPFQGASPLEVEPSGGLSQQSIKALVKAFTSQIQPVNGALRSRSRARDGVRGRRSSSRRKFGDSFKGVFGGKPKDGGGR